MPNPLWLSQDVPPHSPLDKDLKVDAVVIGAGITGATTAYLLKKAGLKVALLEKGKCLQAETGHTSAHLTYVTDVRLHKLVDAFGLDVARAVWDAGQSALYLIDDLVRQLRIDCDFAWVPGYLHAPWNPEEAARNEHEHLQRDAELAQDMGFDATFVDVVPLANQPGVRFANQAMFHPVKYVQGLLRHVTGNGCNVYEESEVDKIDDAGIVHCRGHKVHCDRIVMATHMPIASAAAQASVKLLNSRLAAYTTYVVSSRIASTTEIAPALFWDTASPYHFLRFYQSGASQIAIFGGGDHKTGQLKDTTEPFLQLEKQWSQIFPGTRIGLHWSGQVLNSQDDLPFIGEIADRQYVATGFAGNGLTFGSFAAQMIRDAVIGAANPWTDLFRPDRGVMRRGVWSYVTENFDYVRYFLQDRLMPAQTDSTTDVARGEGKIVRINGERLAVYRDSEGQLSCHSAVCTHMGCHVRWNNAERTWDCPCHGSRFKPTGEVIAGPATAPLEERAPSSAGR